MIACAAVALFNGASVGIAQQGDTNLARLAALETKLDSLEREIEILEATKAIKRVQRAYGYYVSYNFV